MDDSESEMSDYQGLSAYLQWQDPNIPGPSYVFYEFWVTSSRMTDIKQRIKVPKTLTESEIKDALEEWVREVFPMFDYTDAYVQYGWRDG